MQASHGIRSGAGSCAPSAGAPFAATVLGALGNMRHPLPRIHIRVFNFSTSTPSCRVVSKVHRRGSHMLHRLVCAYAGAHRPLLL